MNAKRSLKHPADELTAAMNRIYQYRMTTTSGGNLSIRDETGAIWITPARVDKGNLTRDDIVCVKPDGTVIGRHKPSSEFPFHQQIYEVRPELGAIVHAHPVALVSFSVCGIKPDTHLFSKSKTVCGEVGYAAYALPGSVQLGQNIAAIFAQGFHCVMLENHGVVVGGESFQEAFERFETLEFTARIQLKARSLGGEVRSLSADQLKWVEKRGGELAKYIPGPADSAEKGVRRELCDFVRRGYQQRLLTSTEGSFSARIDADRFVITAHEVDRAKVRVEDLALIEGDRCEAGKEPSHAVHLHRALYRKHPEIRAIVLATPPNATAFSVSSVKLDVRTIPESYIFLRDVAVLPYSLAYGDGKELADAMTPDYPVALLENGGALVLGRTILDAFDRLEVLESTADAVINARLVGEVKPMNDAVIEELIEAFLK
jgi:L-fuculose-phosphate aldolase